MRCTIPDGYTPLLDLRQTVDAIKRLKDIFQVELSHQLRLTRVSAPLVVKSGRGLNDNLSGKERPVAFDLLETGDYAEIVHSLAKWKRLALYRYHFVPGEGLYTDMNAIRRDEETDNLHSIYVDQWDWETILLPGERTQEKLKDLVTRIYRAFLRTERIICGEFPVLRPFLPQTITFTTTAELEERWPQETPERREALFAKEVGACFVQGIGWPLKNGKPHGSRSPDYDDWNLNGDIIFHYPVLNCAMELSSMGIRVDPDTLRSQLHAAGRDEWANLEFQSKLLRGALPQTAGGGIGQSRLCMFFLQKAHIAEVQSSVWPTPTIEALDKAGVPAL